MTRHILTSLLVVISLLLLAQDIRLTQRLNRLQEFHATQCKQAKDIATFPFSIREPSYWKFDAFVDPSYAAAPRAAEQYRTRRFFLPAGLTIEGLSPSEPKYYASGCEEVGIIDTTGMGAGSAGEGDRMGTVLEDILLQMVKQNDQLVEGEVLYNDFAATGSLVHPAGMLVLNLTPCPGRPRFYVLRATSVAQSRVTPCTMNPLQTQQEPIRMVRATNIWTPCSVQRNVRQVTDGASSFAV